MHGVCNGIFWHRPLGPWGTKRSNIIKFQLQSQFQRFLCQTLCVFSQIKDTKYIRRDFHSDAWVMPYWWDLGVLRGKKKSACATIMVSPPKPLDPIQPNLVCELLTRMGHATSKYFGLPTVVLVMGQKVKYH